MCGVTTIGRQQDKKKAVQWRVGGCSLSSAVQARAFGFDHLHEIERFAERQNWPESRPHSLLDQGIYRCNEICIPAGRRCGDAHII